MREKDEVVKEVGRALIKREAREICKRSMGGGVEVVEGGDPSQGGVVEAVEGGDNPEGGVVEVVK